MFVGHEYIFPINYDPYDIYVMIVGDVPEVKNIIYNIHFAYYALNHVDNWSV